MLIKLLLCVQEWRKRSKLQYKCQTSNLIKALTDLISKSLTCSVAMQHEGNREGACFLYKLKLKWGTESFHIHLCCVPHKANQKMTKKLCEEQIKSQNDVMPHFYVYVNVAFFFFFFKQIIEMQLEFTTNTFWNSWSFLMVYPLWRPKVANNVQNIWCSHETKMMQ